MNTTHNTSDGYVQLYYNGVLATLIDPSTGDVTQKPAGNFFPGRQTGTANPKVGCYGYQNPVTDVGYIYNVIIGTTLDDIKW